MLKNATISSDGLYRYDLTRIWGTDENLVNFIGLNPSTADAQIDDATIRRCISFAQAWGKSGMVMTNLFAFRTRSPKILKRSVNPIGTENQKYVQSWAQKATTTVVAWGTHGTYLEQSRRVMEEWLSVPVYCFGTTKDGQPKHPLYQRKETTLIPYIPA